MGSSPDKREKEEINQNQKQPPLTSNINIFINSDPNACLNMNTGNTDQKNNNIREGDAPPPSPSNEIKQVNGNGAQIKIIIGSNGNFNGISSNVPLNNLPNNNINIINNTQKTSFTGTDNNIDNNSDNNNINTINNIDNNINSTNSINKNKNTNKYNNIDNNLSVNQIQCSNKNFVEGNTTFGNIDNNSLRKEDDKNMSVNNPTKFGNVDINVGKNNRIEEPCTEEQFTKPSNIDNNASQIGINNPERKNDKEEEVNDNQDDNDNDKEYLSMSQSVLLSSHQNLNLNSEEDILKIKKSVKEKVEEGYFPYFFRFNYDKPIFYYIKGRSNLKTLLKSHFQLIGHTDFGEKYMYYNKGERLDENKPVSELNLGLFSIIDVHK